MLDELHDDEPVDLDRVDGALILSVLPGAPVRHDTRYYILLKPCQVERNFFQIHFTHVHSHMDHVNECISICTDNGLAGLLR